MMTRKFSHLVHTALAAGSLTLSGCGGDDTDNGSASGGDMGTTGSGGGDAGDGSSGADDDGTTSGPGTDGGEETTAADGPDTGATTGGSDTGSEDGSGSTGGSETGESGTGSDDGSGTTGAGTDTGSDTTSPGTTGTTGSADTTGTTGSGTGTTGAIDLPPVLVDAEFIGSSGVRLWFSEPVTVVGADPTQWRLSAGVERYSLPIAPPEQQGPPIYYSTQYWEMSLIGQVNGPVYGTLLRDDPVNPDALELLLSEDIYCNCKYWDYYFNNYGNENHQSGIHPHFTNFGSGTVEDLTGNALADIGDWWPEYQGTSYQWPGTFPNLDPRVPIPCPPFTPGACE